MNTKTECKEPKQSCDSGTHAGNTERVVQRRPHWLIIEHGQIPLGGKTLEWKSNVYVVIEREQRQKQYGDVKKGKIEDRVKVQRSIGAVNVGNLVHAIFSVTLRVNQI